MQAADAEGVVKVGQRARHAHHAMIAAGGKFELVGGLVEQVAPVLVGAGNFLQQRAVDLGVGLDAVAFEALGLDRADPRDALRETANSKRSRTSSPSVYS